MAQLRLTILPTGRMDGRSYLLADGEGRAAVVDPDVNVDAILEAVRAQGARVEHILLTHCHFDHVTGADALRRATGAKTAIHRADVSGLSDPEVNVSAMFPMQAPIVGVQVDRALDDGDEIALGTRRIKVLHTPGHTAGGCCYLVEGMLFCGDTLFRGSYGNTVFPGGDIGALAASAARLLALDGGIVLYPGHGEPSTVARERASNPIAR